MKRNEEGKRITKVSLQLVLFHIFLCSKVVEIEEITGLIEIKYKTIIRHIKELQDAGLIKVRFSKKEKGYVHLDYNSKCPFLAPIFSDNKAKNARLEKLIRLAIIMIGLKCHMERPYYDPNSKNQETCRSWYEEKFPNVSIRTMQRDFEELNNIGYVIKYDHDERCYIVDFPDGLEGLDSNLFK